MTNVSSVIPMKVGDHQTDRVSMKRSMAYAIWPTGEAQCQASPFEP